MKNKTVIFKIIGILIIIAIISYILWNNRIISTISLDINPSIKINLNKDNNVKSIDMLNNDAKEIVNKDMKGKKIDEVLEELTENIIEKGYDDRGNINILLHTSGRVTSNSVEEKLKKSFDDKRFHAEIIIIDSITNEDIKLSKKYNISSSKAAYINSISKEQQIEVENIVNESVFELNKTKETGNYCDDGYVLEGDFCSKEIRREKATPGEVCPREYYDYNGKCYFEVESLESDKLICNKEFKLDGEYCIREFVIESNKEYECKSGELETDPHGLKRGVKTPICVDKSNAKAPKLRCLIGPHKVINGKCYVGPAPVINGGCPNNDKKIGNGCYSLDPEDQYQCPDGNIYEKSKDSYLELCPDTFKYSNPTIKKYYCNEGYLLRDNKCIKEEKEKAMYEKYCPEGYTSVDGGKCIDLNKTASKENGYYCEVENSNISNDICIIYEYVDAKHK